MKFCFNQFSTSARQAIIVLLSILLAATGLFAGVQTTTLSDSGAYAALAGSHNAAQCCIGIPVPQPSEGLTTPSTYTVQRGDTLTSIAARFGTGVAAILNVNQLANPDLLYIGQTLALPSGSVPAPQQPQAHALQTRIYGSPEFVAAIEATLTWLAENDPDALARVRVYVDKISIETRPGYGGKYYVTDNGNWCEINTILADLMTMLYVLYHEASHCYQFAVQGYAGNYASHEAFAYGEQIDFMRRHDYALFSIDPYEQKRNYFAAQAGLN